MSLSVSLSLCLSPQCSSIGLIVSLSLSHSPVDAGIDGVLQAYYNCIQRVQLYGPTNASPIINHVANFAAAAQREEPQKGAHVSGTPIG